MEPKNAFFGDNRNTSSARTVNARNTVSLLAGSLILGFSACLLSFQLALGTHFRHSGPLAAPMRWLVALSLLVWAAGIVAIARLGAPGQSRIAIAVIFLASAVALFFFTRFSTPAKVLPVAFADESPEFVVQSGPYRLIRHPFYTAYILFWIGFGFAAPHPGVAVGCVAIVVAYFFLARREERRLLEGPLGASYKRYSGSTGRFLPRLHRR
jgi:protein-S-isoprenylcysteine O-methyltransferase Ste14